MNVEENARTCGDGMENVSVAKVPETITPRLTSAQKITRPSSSTSEPKLRIFRESQPLAKIPGEGLIYQRDYSRAPVPQTPITPRGKIFNLIPRLVSSHTTFTHSNKSPRFVPFEPYKAAIHPIVPIKPKALPPNRKNNLDLNTLVSHMKLSSQNSEPSPKGEPEPSEITVQKQHYERQLADLRKDRDCVAAQLKSQVQVNAELKNLLVAAVGEDLQTRVNVLTEDKLELARALLNSAEHLSSHTEQIEFLAGQSEVWRSKFLASSLMVEELARWKASLTNKNCLLLESNKQMLQTMATIRDLEIETWTNLKFMCGQRDPNLPSSNALDLTAECLNISQQLVLNSGIGIPSPISLAALDKTTPAEKLAIQALQNSTEPLMSTEDAFRAIVGQAFPAAAKRYPSHPTEHIEEH